jgi:hypothetical protein
MAQRWCRGLPNKGLQLTAFQRPLGSGSQARLTRSVKCHAEEYNTADLSRWKGHALACVHGTCRNPEVLRKTVAVQDSDAAMLAVHQPVDGSPGASSTERS